MAFLRLFAGFCSSFSASGRLSRCSAALPGLLFATSCERILLTSRLRSDLGEGLRLGGRLTGVAVLVLDRLEGGGLEDGLGDILEDGLGACLEDGPGGCLEELGLGACLEDGLGGHPLLRQLPGTGRRTGRLEDGLGDFLEDGLGGCLEDGLGGRLAWRLGGVAVLGGVIVLVLDLDLDLDFSLCVGVDRCGG